MEESVSGDGASWLAPGVDGLSTLTRPTSPVRAPQQSVLRSASSECLLGSWVAETLLVAERAAAGSPDALSLFWLRLYGVLTDVADFVALTLDDVPSRDGLCMFPLARERSDASPLPLAMAQIKASFDEDELLYIEYQRHAECDPFQTRYRARRRAGAAGQVPSALLGGRPFTVDQAEGAFRRLLSKHGFNEACLGMELARRSLPALQALVAAAG